MAETTVVQPVGSRRAAALLGLLAVGVAAVALAAWISGLDHSPGWSGPVFALITACMVAAVMALKRSWRDPQTWVAAIGLVLIAVGSGIGRPREETWTHMAPATGFDRGDVIERLDTWWVLVAIGLLLSVVATVGALRSSGARSSGLFATASLLGVGVGYTVVALTMRDLVVGSWISGRPLRNGRRQAGATRDAVDCLDPGDLWRVAAADEAEAAAAFSNLADRLTRVGAPASLVSRCHEAAREERRHTATCLHLADHLGSPPPAERPAPSSSQTPTPTTRGARNGSRRTEILRLATESFVDGVVGEGFAARRLEAGSKTVAGGHGPRLRLMALEERSHAALGADIVRWALQQQPRLVHGALRRVALRLPTCTEVPAAHRVFTPAELRRVGLVDPRAAEELWGQQRAAGLCWLDDTLASHVAALNDDRGVAAA